MTNFQFPKYTNHIIHIGTAGGQTKASSGYTFQFIQKQSERITESLLRNGQPFYEDDVLKRRFGFYDSTLLNILANNKLPGDQIFTELFQKNKMVDVLRFLDNETTLTEELRLITVLPKKVFLKERRKVALGIFAKLGVYSSSRLSVFKIKKPLPMLQIKAPECFNH
jgi:lycopene beta-cyclase